MLTYRAKNNLYPDNKRMRSYTRRPKKQRNKTQKATTTFKPTGVNINNFKKAKAGTLSAPPRLCGDLTFIKQHFAEIDKITNSIPCEVCGKQTA